MQHSIVRNTIQRNFGNRHQGTAAFFVGIHDLPAAADARVRTIKEIAQQQQYRVVVRKLLRLPDRMPEAKPVLLMHIGNMLPHPADPLLAGRHIGRQFPAVLFRQRRKEAVKLLLLVFPDNQADLFDPRLQQFIHHNHQGGLQEPVSIQQRQEALPDCFCCRENACSESGQGNDCLLHGLPGLQRQGKGRHSPLLQQIVLQRFCFLFSLCQELDGSVTLGSHAFSAVNKRFDFRIVQHRMQDRSRQFRACRRDFAVKVLLGFPHQLPEFFRPSGFQQPNRPGDDLLVVPAERFLHQAVRLALRKGIRLVQVRQYFDGILGRHQVRDDPVEGRPDPQFAGIDFHTVKVHQDRLDAVSTGLVQPAATRRRALLSAEGSLHLALDIHFQSVQLVKSPGYQNTDGCGR